MYCDLFQGATSSFLIQELDRRKSQLKTQLVWVGAQKEPGLTSRTWKWVDGMAVSVAFSKLLWEIS